MLYACAARFDVTKNLEIFLVFLTEQGLNAQDLMRNFTKCWFALEPTHRRLQRRRSISPHWRSGSVPQRRSSAPSPTRAQARSQGSDLPRVGGSPSAASSDGGAVPGSAAASVAPPPASRQSPRTLASVLRAPAGDPAYAPPSILPPLLYRGSPASCPWWPGLGSAGVYAMPDGKASVT